MFPTTNWVMEKSWCTTKCQIREPPPHTHTHTKREKATSPASSLSPPLRPACSRLLLVFNGGHPFMLHPPPPPPDVLVIYTCRGISAASIFYPQHLFFIRGECSVTLRYCCFCCDGKWKKIKNKNKTAAAAANLPPACVWQKVRTGQGD